MKKTIKKILSIFAAFFLVLGLTTGVRAEDTSKGTNNNTGKITVTNPIEGKTYSLYQLLVLESYNNTLGAYSYTVANGWESFFKSEDIEGNYIKFDATGKYVTWIKDENGDNADPVAFSKEALNYAQKNSIKATATKTADQKNSEGGVLPIEFTDLNLGYYLLDSSAGALCSLQTTNPTVNITEKNSIPTVEKQVKEDSKGDSTDAWGNKNDAQIGDTVEFKATINVGNNTLDSNAGAQNYVLHDTMSSGLTYKGVTKVELKRGENTSTAVETTDYTVKTTDITEGETFNVEFTKSFCDTLKQNDVIVVYYEAVINENAVIAGNGNDNKVNLTYGDKNEVNKTPDSTTKTFTWPVGIYKYADKEEEIPLAGAQFQLKTSTSEKETALKLIDVTGTGGGEKAIPTYRIATQEELSNEGVKPVETITTSDDGKFVIQGLNAGKYYLHETKAPDGYNKLAAPIEITVSSSENSADSTKLDYTITSTGKNDQGQVIQIPADNTAINGNQTVKVLNTTGAQLPATGGMGTTMLYVIGGILLVGSAILLVTRKRMSH
ncbi:isopeptide-forming domain-containing fimbrial protein [Dubosiella newyorkensis]|jgi:fimbrial isopeptide formation D2 family protein/LPXTG-motif cell wall-anchored protein|uniref:isopeptide-forming domain-containing fimbrial protein n=2 Tax=Dubosiella newyorkensis TaxID=1862672 RepID=UPI0023F174F2|nr:SpaA isopeptide-forming pilin-related protein [Dubosiella newyorkensis]